MDKNYVNIVMLVNLLCQFNTFNFFYELLKFFLNLKGFGAGFDPLSLTPGHGRLETLRAEGHIFKMLSRLQITPGSTGYFS